jgi:hypothetical protein
MEERKWKITAFGVAGGSLVPLLASSFFGF